MAREMTPQERADLNMIAYNLVLQINEITPVQWDKYDEMDRAIVLAALQATRRAALLECRDEIGKLMGKDSGNWNRAIVYAADVANKLAQEGA